LTDHEVLTTGWIYVMARCRRGLLVNNYIGGDTPATATELGDTTPAVQPPLALIANHPGFMMGPELLVLVSTSTLLPLRLTQNFSNSDRITITRCDTQA
jgi:hypothetical protein